MLMPNVWIWLGIKGICYNLGESHEGVYWAVLRVFITSSYRKSRSACNCGDNLCHCIKSVIELYCSMKQYSSDNMWVGISGT